MTIGGRTRIALEREKTLVLRSIKELEFDFAMGKIAKADFDEMSGRLRARALGLMRQLDAGGGYQGADRARKWQERLSRSVQSRARVSDAKRSPQASVRSAAPRTIPTRSSARTAERSCDDACACLAILASGFCATVLRERSERASRHARSVGDCRHAAAGAGAARSHRDRARRARADGQQHRRPGGDAQGRQRRRARRRPTSRAARSSTAWPPARRCRRRRPSTARR